MTVYNIGQGYGVKIGDSVAIPEPFVQDVEVNYKDKVRSRKWVFFIKKLHSVKEMNLSHLNHFKKILLKTKRKSHHFDISLFFFLYRYFLIVALEWTHLLFWW